MNISELRPISFATGAGSVLLLWLGQTTQATPTPAARWEHRIAEDVTVEAANALARDGWEYAGYLGQSPKGRSVDETLWRRAAR